MTIDLARADGAVGVRDLRIAADVIPVRRSEFEAERARRGTLVHIVVTEGRIDGR